MKRTNLAIMVFLLCIGLVSCSQQEKKQNQENILVDENKQSTITEVPLDDSDNDHITPPLSVTFGAIEDVEAFISAANATESQYNEFVNGREDQTLTLIGQKDAQIIASNIMNCQFPIVKEGVAVESFGGTYYVDRSEMNIVYGIGGVKYRFILSFNVTEPFEYEGTPVLTDVVLGDKLLDLYQGDVWIYGSVSFGENAIRVGVFTQQPEVVDFSGFIFCPFMEQR